MLTVNVRKTSSASVNFQISFMEFGKRVCMRVISLSAVQIHCFQHTHERQECAVCNRLPLMKQDFAWTYPIMKIF